jgi:uncharacterized Fe-S cluster protein YjdI
MKPITKRYTNGEVTVVWQPHLCIHSGICFRGLPAVFDPRRRPWVMPENAASAAIVAQVGRCPSGALSMAPAEAPAAAPAPAEAPAADSDAAEVTRIEATSNGPLLVYGSVLVRGGDGRCELRDGTTALCRCGGSANKPFCDGSHAKIGFRG